jgi:biotin carboxyl carrier protein
MTEQGKFQTLCIAETEYETTLTKKFQNRKPYTAPNPGNVRCVIPGVIQKLYVRPGQQVRMGEPLCILEAMKMQNDIVSPFDARIRRISVEVGQMVTNGQLLMEIVPIKPE